MKKSCPSAPHPSLRWLDESASPVDPYDLSHKLLDASLKGACNCPVLIFSRPDEA